MCVCVCGCEWEREIEIERQIERERETDRQKESRRVFHHEGGGPSRLATSEAIWGCKTAQGAQEVNKSSTARPWQPLVLVQTHNKDRKMWRKWKRLTVNPHKWKNTTVERELRAREVLMKHEEQEDCKSRRRSEDSEESKAAMTVLFFFPHSDF